MTQIRQVTGELIVVPNSFLFKNPVYVLTNKQVRRITLTVGIAYDEQVDQAIPVIEKALKDCKSIDKNLPLEVFMAEFGASSVDIEVTWWANSTPLGQRSSRNEVVAAIKRALDEANIEIPYPYRTLVFKDPIKVNTATNEEK
ncbi:MscS Mechanosensitive ion channel [gamma proteobacterium IMCC2047]|nr:MscS Mechanosensitive ion channel [gamma proteobacterium IMCC2047]